MLEASTADRVLRLSLNRPERRNALSMDLCSALVSGIEHAEEDPSIGAILLTGNGPAFCSGMDLDESLLADQERLGQIHERLFTVIERARKPIVAAVCGPAVAGGTGLVANAHIVFASPQASFGLTEIRVGLWPMLIWRAVVAAIGERRATEWSVTGRLVAASEAQAAGLVTQIAADPVAAAEQQARKVARYSANALETGLSYARKTRGMSWSEAGALARGLRNELSSHGDFVEGVQAFRQKRSPRWHPNG